MKNGGNTLIVTIIIAALLVVGGAMYFSGGSDDTMMEEDVMMEGDEMMDDSEVMMEEDVMMDDDAMMMSYSGEVLAGSASPLLEFTESDYGEAVQSGKLVVLYFYANWCPICKAEFPKMQTAFNKLTGDDVVGFRVNFNDSETTDAEEALAREFGVAYQHTKVFVQNGTRVLKAPDSWEESRYLSEINKAR